jgi:hypothetical protein
VVGDDLSVDGIEMRACLCVSGVGGQGDLRTLVAEFHSSLLEADEF